jgi:beta-phosphoglucomutase
MKSAIFFDVDDTLCSTGVLHTQAFRRTFVELGMDFSEFEYQNFSGHRTEDVFSKILGENEKAKIAEASKLKRMHYRESIEEVKPMKGAIELLQHLRSTGRKLYAVSSGSSASVTATLAVTHLTEFFEEIITCETVNKTKPHPDPYERAIELSGCAPIECLAVEDSETGTKSAVAAGLEVALISPALSDWTRSYHIQHYQTLEQLLVRFQEKS